MANHNGDVIYGGLDAQIALSFTLIKTSGDSWALELDGKYHTVKTVGIRKLAQHILDKVQEEESNG